MDCLEIFIKPNLPDSIKPLYEIASNVWSCWDLGARKLFHRMDPTLFRALDHNPIELLYRLSEDRLKELSEDEGFLYELKSTLAAFHQYMGFRGTYQINGEEQTFSEQDLVAYICMEYGLHESIPNYSGGLAVLAGDLLKSASDIGCPMVGFGLLYNKGYFKQHITFEGAQVESYRTNQWYLTAVQELFDDKNQPLMIEIPLKERAVQAKIWKVQVGRVPLYLLDTNIPQNAPELQRITQLLYDSDRRMRLEQELILGRGSVLAMKAMGIYPKVYHLNEGHTAFSILQRLIDLKVEKGYSLEEARTVVRHSTVFTTHTPVIAGNENFSDKMVGEYLEREAHLLGISLDELMSFGKVAPYERPKKSKEIKEREEEPFWLPVLALRHAARSNAVSDLHTLVSRKMWKDLYPHFHEREIPIHGVTNGVHLQSWLSLQMTEVFDRYIGPDYVHKAQHPKLWEKIKGIPEGEIWNAHRRRKEQMISFIRRRIGDMMRSGGYCTSKVKNLEAVLNPSYLTIGFARRVAEYKRADLILRDPERLIQILTNKKMPVQIIFAGKAHPADGIGKDIIKRIVSFINRYPVEHQVIFLEDYDINVARHLVQGVDVWLNTPRKPMEASGTSGIKAGINGALNLSVLDGWWPEAYDGGNGWAITAGENYSDDVMADEVEAAQIYNLLENEISELYYDSSDGDFPIKWAQMMKQSIATVAKGFNMNRVAKQYLEEYYIPERILTERLVANHSDLLKQLVRTKKIIDAIWRKIYIKDYFTNMHGNMPFSGERVAIDCYVFLDDVDETLIQVEVFYCFCEQVTCFKKVPLRFVEKYSDKVAKYVVEFTLEGVGLQRLGLRIVPANEEFREVFPEYIKWRGDSDC